MRLLKFDAINRTGGHERPLLAIIVIFVARLPETQIFFAKSTNKKAHPRMVMGALLLRHMTGVSDEKTARQIGCWWSGKLFGGGW